MPKKARDITKAQTKADFILHLRRLADALEHDQKFEISIAGERVYVPVRAAFSIEHERDEGTEEVEFQVSWDRE
jgi:amphi-Trp domain-containing protein